MWLFVFTQSATFHNKVEPIIIFYSPYSPICLWHHLKNKKRWRVCKGTSTQHIISNTEKGGGSVCCSRLRGPGRVVLWVIGARKCVAVLVCWLLAAAYSLKKRSSWPHLHPVAALSFGNTPPSLYIWQHAAKYIHLFAGQSSTGSPRMLTTFWRDTSSTSRPLSAPRLLHRSSTSTSNTPSAERFVSVISDC